MRRPGLLLLLGVLVLTPSTAAAAPVTLDYTVTTDSRGAFRLAWKPRTSGTYTITSASRDPAPGPLADHNCDLALSVR